MKQRSDFLFRNHLDSEEAYEECRRFWESMFQELITEEGMTAYWEDYMSQIIHMGDGSVMTVFESTKRWGGVSPILSKKSEKLGKVLNITQFGVEDGNETPEGDPEGWLDVRLHSKDFYLGYEHDTCDIYVLLTKEILGFIRSAVREWVKADVGPSELCMLAHSRDWLWLKWWVYSHEGEPT